MGLSVDHFLHRVRLEVRAMVKLWVCLQTAVYIGWRWKVTLLVGVSVDNSLHKARVKSHPLAETVGLSVDHSLHRARVKSCTLAEKVGLSVDHSLHNIVQWNFKTTLKVESG